MRGYRPTVGVHISVNIPFNPNDLKLGIFCLFTDTGILLSGCSLSRVRLKPGYELPSGILCACKCGHCEASLLSVFPIEAGHFRLGNHIYSENTFLLLFFALEISLRGLGVLFSHNPCGVVDLF